MSNFQYAVSQFNWSLRMSRVCGKRGYGKALWAALAAYRAGVAA